MRFTITRAVSGFSLDTSHSASARRRPEVRPLAGGIAVGVSGLLAIVKKPGCVSEPRLFTSPRIKKYDGGAAYRPGPLNRNEPSLASFLTPLPGAGSSPGPSGVNR